MMKNNSNLSILIFSFTLFIIHFSINEYITINIDNTFLIKIHIFIILLTIVVLNTLKIIKNKFPDKVGFGYLAFVLVKMIISILFLFPYIRQKPANLKLIVINFFLIFFIHLFYEAYSTIKKLKT